MSIEFMNPGDAFITASRTCLRFAGDKGLRSTEDLWKLSIAVLNGMAVEIYNEMQTSSTISFIPGDQPKGNSVLQLKLDILKYIIAYKSNLEASAKAKALVKAREEELFGVLEQVRNKELLTKSPAEIQAMIDALRADPVSV